MEANWDFYLFDDQGAVSSNFLNLDLVRDAPVSSRPILGLIKIAMLAPRSDGLSSDSEAPILNDLEDSFANVLSALGSIHCGRTTGRGARTLVFYTDSANAFESAARAAAQAFPRYVCQIETKPDPEWRHYLDFLFPSSADQERMRNKRVLDELVKRGDQLDRPREIDHWAFFDDTETANLFARGLAASGFALRAPPTAKGQDGRISIQFWRVDSPRRINDITPAIAEIARKLGGEYDGWECPVEL